MWFFLFLPWQTPLDSQPRCQSSQLPRPRRKPSNKIKNNISHLYLQTKFKFAVFIPRWSARVQKAVGVSAAVKEIKIHEIFDSGQIELGSKWGKWPFYVFNLYSMNVGCSTGFQKKGFVPVQHQLQIIPNCELNGRAASQTNIEFLHSGLSHCNLKEDHRIKWKS